MNLSGLAKFLTGVTLAIAILFFAGVTTARYLITRLTATPAKPIFPNDRPEVKTASLTQPTPPSTRPTTSSTRPTSAFVDSSPSPTVSAPPASASLSPKPTEPEVYEARVTQPIGLVLRQGPSRNADPVGGIEYNSELTVLETSSDGEWLRVRLAGSDVEGWIKSGNTERLN